MRVQFGERVERIFYRQARLWLLVMLVLIGSRAGLAQSPCTPFNLPKWLGTVTFGGSSSGSVFSGHGFITASVDVRIKLLLDQVNAAGCGWLGTQTDHVVLHETLVYDCDPSIGGQGTETLTYDGSINNDNPILPQLTILNVPPFLSQYNMDLRRVVNATHKMTGCGVDLTETRPEQWYNSNGLPFQAYLPLPSSGLTLSGSTHIPGHSYLGADQAIPIDYAISWKLAGDDDDSVDNPCHANPAGSAQTDCENQTVEIDPPIVGTPFELHYVSDREPGRSSASGSLAKFTSDLGGWTLNVRHFYDVSDGTLYLGQGGRRRADVLGSPPIVNGKYLLTSEDGAEAYEFDSTGRHLRTLDPLTGAAIYQFGYDSGGHLTTVTDVSGNVTTIQGAAGSPSAIVGPYGQTTTLTVNSDGYITRITNPNQESVNLAYGPGGLVTSWTDGLGNSDSFHYDSQGLLTQANHAGGGSENLVANDSDGDGPDSVTLTTAAGLSTTYGLDFSTPGVVAETVTYPSGLKGSMQDSSSSRSVSLPNGMLVSTTVAPDPRWGIQAPIPSTQIATPGGLTSSTVASRTMNLSDPSNPFSMTSQTDTVTVNGRTYTQTYTASNRTQVSKTPEGRQVTTVFDANGRVTQRQALGLFAANYTYDSRGRLSSITQGSGPEARSTSFTYDSNGNVNTITDPLGKTRNFTYDPAGRISSAQAPDGRTVSYTYDAASNLLSLTPPGRSAYAFSYSPANLLSKLTAPPVGGGNQEQYAYDPDGKLTQVTRADGQTLAYAYDSGGRLSTVTAPTATLTYNYDGMTGNLSGITGASGADLSYSYDGNLLTGINWTGTLTGGVSLSYDNNFRVTSVSAGTVTVPFQYDNDSLVVGAGAMNLTRDAQNGLVTATSLGSVSDATSYNGFGEPVSYSASVSAAGLYSAQMTRDKASRITTLTETVGASSSVYGYSYDDAGRLLQVTKDGAAAATCTYDSNGNRLTYTGPDGTILNANYDAQDRLTQYGSTSYSYTDSGELTSRTAGGQTTSFNYDVLGNLISVTLPDGTQIAYLVDGRNRRIGKKVNGLVVQGFLYQDKLRPLVELDGAGNLVSVFIYSRDTGAPDYMINGGSLYRILSDHLGSPRLVVNTANGQIVQQLDYDAFGNVLRDTNPGFQPFGFAGGLYDRDTKLLRFGARDYDPQTGRWTAKDPIQFAAGDANLYGYVENDPVNQIDPTGLDPQVCSCEKNWAMARLIWREILLRNAQLHAIPFYGSEDDSVSIEGHHPVVTTDYQVRRALDEQRRSDLFREINRLNRELHKYIDECLQGSEGRETNPHAFANSIAGTKG